MGGRGEMAWKGGQETRWRGRAGGGKETIATKAIAGTRYRVPLRARKRVRFLTPKSGAGGDRGNQGFCSLTDKTSNIKQIAENIAQIVGFGTVG